MTETENFKYVEFASTDLLGFRNYVMRVNQVPEWARIHGHRDCFSTYFLFDSGLPEHTKKNSGSVAGYKGPCYAHYLPLDIDSPDLGRALQTAREISRYLLDRREVPEEALPVYYSGMKGFHLYIATDVFGEVEPCEQLPGTFRELRRTIVREARVSYPEAVDFSISDRLRLLRLLNTHHGESGLFKIALELDELFSREPEEIRDLAQWRWRKRPRLTDPSGLLPRYRVEPVPEAVDMYKRCTSQAERTAQRSLPDPGSYLGNADLTEALCAAELELYREGVPEGARSSMCLRLASRLRSAGYAQEKASGMVSSFAGRCRPPVEEYPVNRIVDAAYNAQGKGYQFGCGTGEGDPPQTRLVYERCPYKNRSLCEKYAQFQRELGRNGGGQHEA
jgi:hypothetical protein